VNVVEGADIGWDPSLRPSTDVGTLDVTIVGPSGSRQEAVEPSTYPNPLPETAKPRSGPENAPQGRKPGQAPEVDNEAARERGYYG
jgi:hypothetical protein